MKLLFLWIESSRNGFIKECGFNIAGKYTWKYDINSNRLIDENKIGYIDNFWGRNIEDLTVVVGSNGAGKSTLLSEIFNYNFVDKIKKHNTMNFLPLPERKIVVYEEDGNIYYDHNLQCEVNVPPFVIKRAIDTLNYITKIFVSNSIEKNVGHVGYNGEGIYEYSLTDFTISSQSNQILSVNQIGGGPWHYPPQHADNRENKINELIHIDEGAYDNVDTLIKLFFFVYSPSDQYMGKEYTRVNIHIKMEGEIYGDRRTQEQIRDFENLRMLNCRYSNALMNSLITYYCFELIIYFGNSFFVGINSWNLEEIKEHLEQCVKKKEMFGERCQNTEYFFDALEDLMLFEKLANENKLINQGFMNEKGETYKYLEVDLRKNKVFFNRIFSFYKKKRTSFLLRYINFRFDDASSGEEALLKLYSRIFWIYNAEGCRKKNLILIDEIDLYMHPKWQRNLVNCLIEDLEKLIGKESRAQIIITSHSPIFLSDIPKANVVFLTNKCNKCVVDDNNYHQDTFGNNIHTLFLDSFFLDEEGTMGVFAENKINGILGLLRSEKRLNDEKEEVKKVISCIGDCLIKQKLLELYEKNQRVQFQLEQKEFLNNDKINKTIQMLKRQVEELQKTIKQLEQMKND